MASPIGDGSNGHELEQTPDDSEGQGSLVCCSPWGHKESDTTKQLNNNKIIFLDSASLTDYSRVYVNIAFICTGGKKKHVTHFILIYCSGLELNHSI